MASMFNKMSDFCGSVWLRTQHNSIRGFYAELSKVEKQMNELYQNTPKPNAGVQHAGQYFPDGESVHQFEALSKSIRGLAAHATSSQIQDMIKRVNKIGQTLPDSPSPEQFVATMNLRQQVCETLYEQKAIRDKIEQLNKTIQIKEATCPEYGEEDSYDREPSVLSRRVLRYAIRSEIHECTKERDALIAKALV